MAELMGFKNAYFYLFGYKIDKGIFIMKKYVVTKIDGEYATLADEAGEELFIAMALLPLGVDIGTRLCYEFPDFSIDEG